MRLLFLTGGTDVKKRRRAGGGRLRNRSLSEKHNELHK
jgi:hypothetical protein